MKNSFTLVGNIGQKPELKKSAKGTNFLRFSIAVSDDIKDKATGEWTKRPAIWFNLVVFGEKAEQLEKVLDKGVKVSVSGKLEMKKEGDAKYATPDLKVFQVDLLNASSKNQEADEDSIETDF